MRILVLGAGGIGGYFGARLVDGGADVTFLVRSARAAKLAAQGLVVRSPLGDLALQVKTATQVDAAFDVVLLACKAYDLGSAIDAIAPAVGPRTLVLPLLNGLKHLDALDARFGEARVLGGLCQIGVTLGENGEIRHLDRLQHLALGARFPEQQLAAREIHKELERGRFALTLSEAIRQDMWDKFVFLTAYAAVTCLMRAAVGDIAATQEGTAIARELLAECVATATACGQVPGAKFLAWTDAVLTDRASAGTSSMLRDIRRGAHTEHEHILGDMYARARAAAVPTPALRIACAHLQSYEMARQRPSS